jgi:hypothetical protein
MTGFGGPISNTSAFLPDICSPRSAAPAGSSDWPDIGADTFGIHRAESTGWPSVD